MTNTCAETTIDLTALPTSLPRYADCQHIGEIIIKDDRPLYCADCGQVIHAEAAACFCVGVLATEYREDGEISLEMLSGEKEQLAAVVEGYLYHNPGATGDDAMACARNAWGRIRTETDERLQHG